MSFETEGAIYLMVKCSQKRDKGLEKGAMRKLIESGTWNRLWDDCLEHESYIRSNTAHGIYKLDGEDPKTILFSDMSNISQL